MSFCFYSQQERRVYVVMKQIDKFTANIKLHKALHMGAERAFTTPLIS